jgi:putative DNA primase/helicase
MTLPALRELQSHRRWVNWRYAVMAAGRRTKIPYMPSGRPASTTDPATWSAYEEVARATTFDGNGFVGTHSNYVGVDLDHAGDGRTVAPWAQAIVRLLDSYTEWSPSTRGLRIWCRGPFAPGGRRRKGFGADHQGALEVYGGASPRYLTVTGAHLAGTPVRIEERAGALAVLAREYFPEPAAPAHAARPISISPDDRDLLAEARGASPQFRRLWDGDTSAFPSRSEADYVLARELLRWTGGDIARADRLFRQSSLFRPKWDEQRGAETYGARTLRKATT